MISCWLQWSLVGWKDLLFYSKDLPGCVILMLVTHGSNLFWEHLLNRLLVSFPGGLCYVWHLYSLLALYFPRSFVNLPTSPAVHLSSSSPTHPDLWVIQCLSGYISELLFKGIGGGGGGGESSCCCFKAWVGSFMQLCASSLSCLNEYLDIETGNKMLCIEQPEVNLLSTVVFIAAFEMKWPCSHQVYTGHYPSH